MRSLRYVMPKQLVVGLYFGVYLSLIASLRFARISEGAAVLYTNVYSEASFDQSIR